MTSVAYSGRPERPGWIDVALALVVGWLAAAIAMLGLYGTGTLVGAISRPYSSSGYGGINNWPFAENGPWSVFANISVLAIALVLTTVATSRLLRTKYAAVSDGRLAIAIFFGGWFPLWFPSVRVASHAGGRGFTGFLIALVLVRYWAVGRDRGSLGLKAAASVVAVLTAVVVSYGVLHPLWTASAFPGARKHAFIVDVHNAALVGVTIDHIDTSDISQVASRPARLHLAPGDQKAIALTVDPGCGTAVFFLHARYHLFGLAFRESLPVEVKLQSWDRDGC